MTIETVLTSEKVADLCKGAHNSSDYHFARAIERAVMQSPEMQRLREDAGRIDWIARQDLDDICFSVIQDAPDDGMYCVNAGRGPFVGDTFRSAIDAAMEKQP